MMNRVCLVGRITKELELRKTNNNMSVCSFTLAVQSKTKNDKGEYMADFIPCTAWNKTAEFMTTYLHKGSLISVEGRIKTSSYDTPDGKRYRTDVIAEDVQSLESKKNDDVVKGSVNGGSFELDYEPQQNLKIAPNDLPFY